MKIYLKELFIVSSMSEASFCLQESREFGKEAALGRYITRKCNAQLEAGICDKIEILVDSLDLWKKYEVMLSLIVSKNPKISLVQTYTSN